jgi:hypothetical protein
MAGKPQPIYGEMESFAVKRNGDVIMTVSVPLEGIRQEVRITRAELAGMAEASRNKRI